MSDFISVKSFRIFEVGCVLKFSQVHGKDKGRLVALVPAGLPWHQSQLAQL